MVLTTSLWIHRIRLGLLVMFAFSLSSVAGEKRENVLFIAVDDLANVLGSERQGKTPHLDRLAARGVRFERAYCQIPLCNPSRASVMTGLRPDSTCVYDLDRHFRESVPDAITLPQLFKNHGWFSARVGKIYHYDVPKGIGTDGLDDPASWDRVVNPRGRDVEEEGLIINPTPDRPVSAALSWHAADGSDEEQTDGMIATEAIRIMEEKRDAPFFLGVGFFRPHTPFVAPKRYFDLHPLGEMKLPEAPADDRSDIPPAALAHNNVLPNYGLDRATCLQALQAYHASVSFMDAQVGRLLDALDRLSLTEKTIVVLWSDHGYQLGEHLGIWQKRCLFEESARSPLIICAPKAKARGVSCRRVVELIDVYPTLADLCGLPATNKMVGRSLRPLLEEPAIHWSSCAVTQILRPGSGRPIMGRTVRTERWRYTEWNEGKDGVELYDHDSDPEEFHNLAQSPSAVRVIPALKEALTSKAKGNSPENGFLPSRL